MDTELENKIITSAVDTEIEGIANILQDSIKIQDLDKLQHCLKLNSMLNFKQQDTKSDIQKGKSYGMSTEIKGRHTEQ